MNVSYRWLRDFLPGLALDARGVAELLTMRAATVDAIEPMRADLAPFVVGRVVESERIPDTKLTINKVDDGSGALLDVVCGAPNVRAGARYPFARVGTAMPGGALTIERRRIRGFASNGMLCSARELGLGENHEGILELETEAAPGTPLLEALDAGDVRIVVDVNPNRPDLLGHIGVAREIAAATGGALSDGFPAGPALERWRVEPVRHARDGVAGAIRVLLDDPEGAPRYLGVVVRGVTIGPSPGWLRERIEAVGGRSVSNVVDVTNFMLQGYAQPMHAFDAAKLRGGAVVVRRARAGETLVTLDGVARSLSPEMTVIADAERAQAVAGVMGGGESEVTGSTRDIFLEVAYFDPARTRRARRALGLSTDASYRFERGIDPEACLERLEMAVSLILAVAGGSVEGAPVDLRAATRSPSEVPIRPSRVERILGAPVAPGEIERLLGAIGFERTYADAEAIRVRVPSWRVDVAREIDLIEEVARLHGYERLPDDLRPSRPSNVPDAPLHLTARRVREALVAEGLLEVRAMPFVKGGEAGYVRVANPLAENEAYLRRDVELETLARRAEHNLAQMQRTVRLFEIGAAFAPAEGKLPREEMRVAALVMGDRHPGHWSEGKPPAFDEWDAKWLAEVTARAAHPSGAVALHPGEGDVLWAIEVDGRALGTVLRLRLDAPVWASPAYGVELLLAELSAEPVAAAGERRPVGEARGDGRRAFTHRPLPTTPASGFDIALLVPDDMPVARVEERIRSVSGPLLERLTLSSEFRGGNVPEGFRSVAWQLTLRHPERTLESREIAGRRERLIRVLEGELGVRVR